MREEPREKATADTVAGCVFCGSRPISMSLRFHLSQRTSFGSTNRRSEGGLVSCFLFGFATLFCRLSLQAGDLGLVIFILGMYEYEGMEKKNGYGLGLFVFLSLLSLSLLFLFFLPFFFYLQVLRIIRKRLCLEGLGCMVN